MAERIIENERGNLPLAIFRPSIVVASVAEPFPGWVDSLAGATGSFICGKVIFSKMYRKQLLFLLRICGWGWKRVYSDL